MTEHENLFTWEGKDCAYLGNKLLVIKHSRFIVRLCEIDISDGFLLPVSKTQAVLQAVSCHELFGQY